MAPQKKQKTPVQVEAQRVETKKTEQQVKLEKYFFRHKHAELYLKLLSTSLLDKIIGVQPEPYMKAIVETVEVELKEFLSSRYEELTGMSKPEESFSKSEATALKLLASKITNKEPSASPPPPENKTESKTLVQEPEPEEPQPGVRQVVNQGVVLSSSDDPRIPVKVEGPTDSMKRVRPKGVNPAPPPNEMQEMMLASMAAQQFNNTMAQIDQARGAKPSPLQSVNTENSVPNFNEPEFR